MGNPKVNFQMSVSSVVQHNWSAVAKWLSVQIEVEVSLVRVSLEILYCYCVLKLDPLSYAEPLFNLGHVPV